MNITALEEYGLRCAARLAALPPDQTLSAKEIAELEGLSVEYVSKFMLFLRKAELVRTLRGVNGGFALAKSPKEITLKELFDALSGKRKISEDFCTHFSGKEDCCVRDVGCSVKPFWQVLSVMVENFTSHLTLDDLVHSSQHTMKKSLEAARQLTKISESSEQNIKQYSLQKEINP